MTLKLIECTRGPAEPVVGGHQYFFAADKSGRFVCDVVNLTHRALLLGVRWYREVENIPEPKSDLSALEFDGEADHLGDGEDPDAEEAARLAAEEEAARAAAEEAAAKIEAERLAAEEAERLAAEKAAAEKLAAEEKAKAEKEAAEAAAKEAAEKAATEDAAKKKAK